MIPVLLDTDIGSDIDDAVCLAYLLAQPQCELLGVTTVTGRPRARAALADAVCRAGGRGDVPIHAGTEDALLGPTPQPEVPQAAVLDRFDHRDPNEFAPNTAVEFLRDMIAARPGEITLLTIGPLTNAALLFATYPETAAQLRALVLMCGVFAGAGTREWNARCDATATTIAYRTTVAKHISVGLDVTTQCVMESADAIERFKAAGGALEVVAAMTEVWASERSRVVFHDPLAGVAVFRPDVCDWTAGAVDVEPDGATVFSPTPDGPHAVATKVDPAAFFEAFYEKLGPT